MGETTANPGKTSLNTPKPSRISPQANTSPTTQLAEWQIPVGVTKANWEYVHASHIASGYDEFLSGDPLTAIDRQIIDLYFPDLVGGPKHSRPPRAPSIADFGCGNGRSLGPLLDKGYRGVGIDLSIPMLKGFAKKVLEVGHDSNQLLLTQANLVELGAFADNSIDHGISLFSTLGMIAGQENRQAFLNHVGRIIRPNGVFILHAHNVWYQLRHPGGLRWAISNFLSAMRGKTEFGDRTANYRNIKNMFIHSFRKSELEQAIRKSGFGSLEWFGIAPGATEPVDKLNLLSSCRLVGWIVVCRT